MDPSRTTDESIVDVTGLQVGLRIERSTPTTPAPQHPGETSSYTLPDYGYELPRLGKQYRKKLQLSKQEEDWLNKFWNPSNVFLAIEGCCIATARLYVRVLAQLEQELRAQQSSLEQVVTWCQGESIRLRKAAVRTAGYTWSKYDEQYQREQTEAIVYSTLFRRCENAVREVYANKRKLAAEFSGLDGALGQQIEEQLGQPMARILPTLVSSIEATDEAMDIALNLQNTTRWKGQFELLAAGLSPMSASAFVHGVYELGRRNARNPAVENIYYEASKHIAKYDREEALRLYVHYVYHDLHSATVNNKQLTKTIQNSLFSQPEHLQRFEAIIQQLVATNNLEEALAQVPGVYAKQRKRIELDLGAIQHVQHQHAGTVELLNEYLQDEPEPILGDGPVAAQTPSSPTPELEEVQLVVSAPSTAAVAGDFPAELGLSASQQLLLTLFAQQNLTVPQAEVEAFARQHGALRNQLIDSINELCYERLDDVLIEEDGDAYTIYDSYYQQLTAPC
ncbi:hypothetical protein LGH70_23070 [Hymenobacter sp. BT635]|uniref:TerB-C domain-containing protein n=1 Tax=Hymenobacter nitidus TaxID=2880929 RepID=A0ABS8ALV6_9BACT|nr:hypothetical protein [Hymenobacter nitidus]